MSKKLSPKELREKAQKFMEKAKFEEEKRYIEVGKKKKKKLLDCKLSDEKLVQIQSSIKTILYR